MAVFDSWRPAVALRARRPDPRHYCFKAKRGTRRPARLAVSNGQGENCLFPFSQGRAARIFRVVDMTFPGVRRSIDRGRGDAP